MGKRILSKVLLFIMVFALGWGMIAGLDRCVQKAYAYDGSWSAVGKAGFTYREAAHLSFFMYNGTPYIAFEDEDNSNKATVMKYDGSSWLTLGKAGFTEQEVDYTSLFVYNGTAYLAFKDSDNGYKATVMKYDGSSWVNVGNAGFSDREVDYTSLYIYNGTPYVAYQDWNRNGKATVKKYNGSSWINVGDTGFSLGRADDIKLVVDQEIPFIAFQDWGRSGKASVMRCDGSTWSNVGNGNISEGQADSIAFFVDNSTPYIAYRDLVNYDRATVKKFTNNSWQDMGNIGYTTGGIALYVENAVPQVAFNDAKSNKRASVMKYNGSGWENLGSSGFSAGTIENPTLYVYNGVSYLAYRDNGSSNRATVMSFTPTKAYKAVVQAQSNSPVIGADNMITITIMDAYGSIDSSFNSPSDIKISGYDFNNEDINYNFFNGVPLNAHSKTITVKFNKGVVSCNLKLYKTSKQDIKLSLAGMADNYLTMTPVKAATGKTVSYNGNGNNSGALPNSSRNHVANEVVQVLSNNGNLVKTGFTFSGWNSQADGKGVDYVPGTSFTMGNTDLILYAKWTAGTVQTINPPLAKNLVRLTIHEGDESVKTAITETVGKLSKSSIVLDAQKLQVKLDKEGRNAVVSIYFTKTADVVLGEISGSMLKNMQNQEVFFEVKTDTASYTVPAKQIDIDAIAQQWGAEAKDIKVQVEIAPAAVEKVQLLESLAKSMGFTIAVPPVDFTVRCIYGKNNMEVKNFNTYVERTMAVPAGVDTAKLTSGIIIEADGSLRQVPSKLILADGKYHVKMNSFNSGSYAVIWNKKEMADLAGHWSQEVSNEMASRMIMGVITPNSFEPERDVNRAEFASIIVKALGLKPASTKLQFTDVQADNVYYGYIGTAYAHNIVSGYGKNSFAPDEKITREQAMSMITQAMNIVGLNSTISYEDANKLLASYKDGAMVSDWARAKVAVTIQNSIVSGKNGLLDPQAEISRAELAVIIKRLMQASGLI